MSYLPGQIVPQTGSYHCVECNLHELSCVKGEPFPICPTIDCIHTRYAFVRVTLEEDEI